MRTSVMFINAQELRFQSLVLSLGGFLFACIVRDLFVIAA